MSGPVPPPPAQPPARPPDERSLLRWIAARESIPHLPMADPPDTLDDVVAAGDQAVLSTKLHVPRPPRRFVSRPRLAERLDRARPGTVTLVCAPAGFGKSVLVADWCRRGRRPVAWLSLDSGDNDPIRFWRHVAATLDRARGGSGPSSRADVDHLIRRSGDALLDRITVAVVNAVAAASDDLVLVLDDYHLVGDAEVHASVRLLLERAPEHLHVVLTSRTDPPLLLARRRARGELNEIRADDLRFEPDEAAGLLAGATATHLSDEAVSTLTDRTEGWAAGLQLARLSLEGRHDASSFLSTFSGSHRFVLDYLTEEVLDRQRASVRDFLLRTSVLQRLSGPLCDAVTGGDHGQELLEECERANLFVVPLDDDRRWWRYHHLFAELLRARLAHESPDLATELHRRAAAWHEAHGLVDEAIGHAIDAGDAAWAARLIERHADELLFRREGATLQRRLAELPADAVASRRLVLAQARIALYAGRPTEAERLIEAAASAHTEPDERFEPSVHRTASPLAALDPTTTLLRAFVAHLRGQVGRATALATGASDDLDGGGSALGLIADWHLATGAWLDGAAAAAEPALRDNIERWRALGDHDRAAWSAHYLGQIQRSRGDLDAAVETYHGVLSIDAGGDSSDAPTAGVAHVGLAEVAYERDDLEAARHHAERGIACCRQFVYTQALSTGLATLASIRRAEGDVESARAAMDEAIDAGPDTDVVDLLHPVPVRRARLLLADGDDRLARQWVAARGIGAGDEPDHPAEPAYLLLARLLIAGGDSAEAMPLLDRLVAAAQAGGRTGSVIEIEVLRALASADDDPDRARSALARAITLAAPQRHLRVFVDEGEPMATLLGELVATPALAEELRSATEHVARLIRTLDRDARGVTGDARARRALVVPLTERELEVVRQLASGKRNREIAAELYVSLDTVKKHVTHIFGKLGVGNRTAAVARARELDLLS